MSLLQNLNLNKSLKLIAAVLADEEDELLLEQENKVFEKIYFDINQSNSACVSVLSHMLGTNTKSARRTDVEHDDHFCNEEVPRLNLETFQSSFGVSRRTVQVLTERLANENSSSSIKFRVPLQKRILMMLWILSNQESFRSVGERFGMMAPGNVHYVFYSMCDSVCTLTKHEVCWPDSSKQEFLANRLKDELNVPNILGVLGCIYISIKCSDKSEQYYDYKGVPSICLQAVCDYKLSFLHIYTGKPGSYTPAKVFQSSLLSSNLDYILNTKLSIIAGVEYPPSPKLNLVSKTVHCPESSALGLISLAFTKLLDTFKRLKYIDMQRLESTVKLIQTACTLHNLVIGNQNETDNFSSENRLSFISDEMFVNSL